jgi:hypothetical protein
LLDPNGEVEEQAGDAGVRQASPACLEGGQLTFDISERGLPASEVVSSGCVSGAASPGVGPTP